MRMLTTLLTPEYVLISVLLTEKVPGGTASPSFRFAGMMDFRSLWVSLVAPVSRLCIVIPRFGRAVPFLYCPVVSNVTSFPETAITSTFSQS